MQEVSPGGACQTLMWDSPSWPTHASRLPWVERRFQFSTSSRQPSAALMLRESEALGLAPVQGSLRDGRWALPLLDTSRLASDHACPFSRVGEPRGPPWLGVLGQGLSWKPPRRRFFAFGVGVAGGWAWASQVPPLCLPWSPRLLSSDLGRVSTVSTVSMGKQGVGRDGLWGVEEQPWGQREALLYTVVSEVCWVRDRAGATVWPPAAPLLTGRTM